MTKADLLLWVQKHIPPLMGNKGKSDSVNPTWQTDYNRFNAVVDPAGLKAALRLRSPPLSATDIAEAIAEYSK